MVALLQRHRSGPRRGVRVRLVGVPPAAGRDAVRGRESAAGRGSLGGAGPSRRARQAHRGGRRGPGVAAGPDGRGDRGPGRDALRTRRAGTQGGVPDRSARRRRGAVLHGSFRGLLAPRPHLAADDGRDPVPGVRPGLHLVPRGRARPSPPAGPVGPCRREPVALPGLHRHRQRQRRGLGAVRGAPDGRAGLPARRRAPAGVSGRPDDAGLPGDRGHRHARGAGDPGRLAVPSR